MEKIYKNTYSGHESEMDKMKYNKIYVGAYVRLNRQSNICFTTLDYDFCRLALKR